MADLSAPAPGLAPRGIGGWLLLPIAGLLLTLGVGLYAVGGIALSPGMLEVALTKLSLTIELAGTAVLWVLAPAVVMVLLALRNRHFPAAFVATNVGLAAFNVLDPFITAIDYGFYVDSVLYAAVPAVWFLGWSWYMLNSVRVKSTFVN